MKRRWLAATLAIVVSAFVAIAVAVRSRDVVPPASIVPPPASVSASSSPVAELPFTTPSTPEEAAWYRVGVDPRDFPPHIQVGTAGAGALFDAAVRWDPATPPGTVLPQRQVAGIGGGVAVLLDDDGTRSFIAAVVAATGDLRELVAVDDVIVDAAVHPSGRHAYYLTADRVTGDLIGAWRLDVRAGAEPERLDALVAGAPSARFAAVSRLFYRLMLSPDGSMLALWYCVELDCALRAVHTRDGAPLAELDLPRAVREPVAISEQFAILLPAVPDGPEAFSEALELATELTKPLDAQIPLTWSFALEASSGSIAIQTAGSSAPSAATGMAAGPPEITVIDLATGHEVARHRPPLDAIRLVRPGDPVVGADLPEGWVLMLGCEPGEKTLSAYAMNVTDGELVPLPKLGRFFVQG